LRGCVNDVEDMRALLLTRWGEVAPRARFELATLRLTAGGCKL
jgi:hypothetical protein